jgi:hypothetical protein
MNKFQKMVAENKAYNATKDYSHITNEYLLSKLNAGLIKYEPSLWAEAQLDPMEENGSR